MANYEAKARSNYFRVKDMATFQAWVEGRGLTLLHSPALHGIAPTGSDVHRVGITPEDCSDTGSWPNQEFNDETGQFDDIDLYGELAEHLQDDSIAILQEIGNEKLCYLTGYAVAINSRGETAEVSLQSITELARRQFGSEVEITAPEY